jgi:uncharacterized membrane protein (UPF0136 family)
MKTNSYITLLYSLIVILSGYMAFSHFNKGIYLLVETGLGTIIFINVFFMIANKKWAFYITICLSIILAIFYGYSFAGSTNFFPGLLTAVSAFVAAINILKLTKTIN